MSMLAEKKRKTKWVINPTKKPLWTTDSNGIKFGKRLMEKMGWSAGKGLGVNEQGIQEPLKVSFKNDTKGMGFKGNDDDWIEHQDEFNCFLSQLRNSDESFVVKTDDYEKNEVKSLEEKSKGSKARVHYQKFTRGKDLSKYSENDLACILGTNKAKKEKFNNEEIEEDSKTVGKFKTDFGVTTINSGSIQDYFKKKWINLKSSKETHDTVDEALQKYSVENFNYSKNVENCVNDEKNSKKLKVKSRSNELENIEATINFESNELEKSEKKKKRERHLNFEEEPEDKRSFEFDLTNNACGLKNKKDESKKLLVQIENYESERSNIKNKNCVKTKSEDCTAFVKKKKKKIFADDSSQDLYASENVDVIEEKEFNFHRKKKKRKTELENEDMYNIPSTVDDTKKGSNLQTLTNKEADDFREEVILKKKKKKSKKEKYFDNNKMEDEASCGTSNEELNTQINAEITNSCIEKEVFKKKKKKDKKEKFIEIEKVECFGNSQVDKCNIEEENKKEQMMKSLDVKEISSKTVLELKHKNKKHKKEKEIQVIENLKPSLQKENIEHTSCIDITSEAELFTNEKKRKKSDKKKSTRISSDLEIELEVESIKKKKKKKKDNEKSVEREVEYLKSIESGIHNCSADVNKSSRKRHNSSKTESVKSKKRKKNEDEKSLEIEEKSINQISNPLDVNEEDVKILNEKNNLQEVESVKKKKKQKKKEKLTEKGVQFVENCNSLNINQSAEEETPKSTGEEKDMLEVEPVKKKKKKDKTREILSHENLEPCSKVKNINVENNEKKTEVEQIEGKPKKEEEKNSFEKKKGEEEGASTVEKKKIKSKEDNSIGKNQNLNGITNNDQICTDGFQSHLNNNLLNVFNYVYNYNNNNNMLNLDNCNVEKQSGVKNHKVELLNEKKADKFYNTLNRQQRILRLIRLSDFSAFKGSNLEKLTGYGFLKEVNSGKSA